MISQVLLGHGGGGQLMDQLLNEIVRPAVGNEILAEGLDSGLLGLPGKGGRVALTIDGYVVTPWKFPGGDIGRLAVCGTVNDLAVCGARPLGLALGLIIAEGFDAAHLREIMASVATAANEAGVKVVTGDTKVVGRTQADGIYITTAGVGLVETEVANAEIEPGDAVLINGSIADHGLAVMLTREMPHLHTPIRSDVAPLNQMIQCVLESGISVRFMRDATRGGVAGVANDIAKRAGRRVVLEEKAFPVRKETRHAAELLGLDVLDVANEGKVVMVVAGDDAERALEIMRKHRHGAAAARIGTISPQSDGTCELRTTSGGSRVVTKPFGEQLPRIC